jgi:hypothetical protein
VTRQFASTYLGAPPAQNIVKPQLECAVVYAVNVPPQHDLAD